VTNKRELIGASDRAGTFERRTSWFPLALAFALGAIAAGAGVYAFQEMNPSPRAPPDATTATPALLSNPAPGPRSAQLVVNSAPPVRPFPVVPAPVAPNAPAPAVERSDLAELNASEIWELQARLEFLGMRPGSLDGIPGPQTAAAIRRYEESRGRAQTGTLDRELLERLRQEPN
jgi:hypothetical protein